MSNPMTDTTDIKAVRDEFTTDQWWYKELLEATKQIHGNLDLRRAVIGVIPNLISTLEAERQRADNAERANRPQKPVVLPRKITGGFTRLAEMYGCEPAQAQFIAVGWNAAIDAAGGIVKTE
jgi:hypothetical protein